jgi:hypothetical protein
MFLSEHAIWQFANAGDELDDWLPYAEALIRKWSDQNNEEVAFQTPFEIIIATRRRLVASFSKKIFRQSHACNHK